ncbi:thiamine/thiamine pyrophosphate ABC transporter permease ThiP [Vibrio mangrovi]|uniref:Thiamine transport system permease protein ThiP n=1 Tax=Vibrio mangrovi TaxID=474394 RepID=A0A1Y6J0T3_9VIBR|nr:thiamine/thiamine pyrophosphate ABC transporter permease ThiP [Vibrio mangrovi]MDW6002852.1 thiamine/thiamine pyrophosphate ABC transporter permease ThiP [Vibrio mangrovi]SMS02342.1 Sulfate transport system permease protein CysW [Vibrio mangrovi]
MANSAHSGTVTETELHRVPRFGLWIAAGVAVFILSAFGALLAHASGLDLTLILADPYYLHVTRFSFYQASLSVLLSVLPAIPVALALRRRSFPGRQFLIKLFSTTLVMPVLVGVFGLLAIYGHSGILARILHTLHLDFSFSVYGLNGILLAHVFFNLPYASRLFLHTLEMIPEEQTLLACHLGMTPWQQFRYVDWPRIRQQLPHVAGLVFMLCFTSFATVMALGGGPQSTTIELAIYQAIKFDFDLRSGAMLALWQMLLCGLLAFLVQSITKTTDVKSQGESHHQPLFRDSRLARCWDCGWILFCGLLVLPPLLMVIISGINQHLWHVFSSSGFWQALASSLTVASVAGTLALVAGIGVLLTSRGWRLLARRRRADVLETVGMMILVTPGLVMSTGLFLLLRSFTDAFEFAYWVVVVVNAMMALPYVIKTLQQPLWMLAQQYQYLCASLGMQGWRRFWLVEWRAVRKPIIHAWVISFLVAMGDLSAIALFGSQDFRTLPLYLYQLLGSYQMESAAVVAGCLLVISLGCFFIADRLFRSGRNINADT